VARRDGLATAPWAYYDRTYIVMVGEGRPSTSSLCAGSKDVDGGADPRVKPEDRHDDEPFDPVERATGGPMQESL
jgi:hypothetical protein